MNEVFREIKQELDFFSTRHLDFPAHIHEDIELVYVKKGGGTAFCDGKKYALREHAFFLVFPNQVHHYADCTSGEYVLLVIKPTRLLSNPDIFLKGYPSSALKTFDDESDDNTAALLNLTLEEYERNGYSTVIDACLTAFFEKLLRFYTIEKGVVSSVTVLKILQYCAEHYKEEITVADVAEALQISRSSVSHIFSNRLAVSFCEHINSMRLADAVKLLSGHNYSVTEIADLAGFPTVRTFNRVFHNQYGVSPSVFRKRMML